MNPPSRDMFARLKTNSRESDSVYAMRVYYPLKIKLETALTLLFVGIGGLLAALGYVLFGSKIRQRIHNDSFRTRSA